MTEVLAQIINIILASGVIYGTLMLVRHTIAQRLAPRLMYMLWFILIIRLLIPGSFEMTLHLPVPEVSAPVQQVSVETEQTPDGSSIQHALPPQPTVKTSPAAAPVDAAAQETTALQATAADISTCIIACLAAGSLSYGVVLILAQWRRRRSVMRDTVPAGSNAQVLAENFAENFRIRRIPRICTAPALSTPCLTVSLRPVILLPEVLTSDLESLRYALSHELMHYKRRDHIVSLLMLILQVVWWFNPFVWLGFRAARQDLECACDSDVAATLTKNDRSAYARLIVEMAADPEEPAMRMALSSPAESLKRRLQCVFRNRSTRAVYKGLVSLLAGVLMVTCFTTACQPAALSRASSAAAADLNVRENLSASASSTELKTASTISTRDESWQFETERGSNLTITADIQVEVPEETSYLSADIRPVSFTQAQVDNLIQQFAPNADFFEYPFAKTRGEIQAEIDFMREEYEAVSDIVNAEEVEDLEDEIEIFESMLPDAPENTVRIPADTQYTYQRDWVTGKPFRDGGRCFVEIGASLPNSRLGVFCARKPGSEFETSKFSFSEGEFTDEGSDLADLSGLSALRVQYSRSEGTVPDMEWIESEQSEIRARLARYAEDNFDLPKAVEEAQKLLDKLEIEKLELTRCEHALFQYYDAEGGLPVDPGLAVPAAFLQYTRQINGIPASIINGCTLESADVKDPLTAVDGIAETLQMVIGTDGNVLLFDWFDPIEVTKVIRDNQSTLPFTEIQDKAIDMIASGYSTNDPDGNPVEANIWDASVQMAYVEENGKLRLIPAWIIPVDLTLTSYMDSGEIGTEVVSCTICLSAADGRPIVKADADQPLLSEWKLTTA